MIAWIIRKLRVFILGRAIRLVERAGLAVVQIKRTEGAIYIVGANGTYVRFEKVKL